MDLQLSEEQKMIRKTAKELATKEIAPLAGKIDETGKVPQDVLQKMADVGLFGILIPVIIHIVVVNHILLLVRCPRGPVLSAVVGLHVKIRV